jgi:hypothetical protein
MSRNPDILPIDKMKRMRVDAENKFDFQELLLRACTTAKVLSKSLNLLSWSL